MPVALLVEPDAAINHIECSELQHLIQSECSFSE